MLAIALAVTFFGDEFVSTARHAVGTLRISTPVLVHSRRSC